LQKLLPFRAAQDCEKGDRQMTTTSDELKSQPKTIVLIEDNEEDLQYWSRTLRSAPFNYTVLESSDAQSGLDLCRDGAIDCVLLDLDMPESGFHVLLELIPNRSRPRIPVIILTHLPHPNLWEMAKHNGAQACLLKQRTSAEELHCAIQTAISSVKAQGLEN
jgi:CheY-like chemotaxis protein